MTRMNQSEKEKIISLIKFFPKKISVTVNRSEDGGFYAVLHDFNNSVTEGDTFSELVEMINDCVYACLDVPAKYAQYMPSYLPSIKAAQKFNVFPIESDINSKTMQFVK